jgi:hypothetical protein
VWDEETGNPVTDLLDETATPISAPKLDEGWLLGAGLPTAVRVASFSLGKDGKRYPLEPANAAVIAQTAADAAASSATAAQSSADSSAASAALVGAPAKSAMDAAFGVDVATVAPGVPRSLALYGVLPGNTAAQNRTGFLNAQASGYTDFVLPPGTYQYAQSAFGQWMMTFTGKSRIRIRGLNAVINDTSAYSNNGPIEGLFLFDNCKDVEVSGIEYVGPVLPTPNSASSGGVGGLGYQGATLVRAINGTSGVKVDMRATNCRYGVHTGDYTTATTGGCKNFDIKIRGSMIGYAIAAYRADGIRHDLDVDGIHRVAYIAGCNDVTGVARWRDQYIAPTAYLISDALTSGTDTAAQADPVGSPTTSRGSTNIDVTVIDKGSTVFQTQSMCAGITLSRIDPCRFENIRVRVYVVGTDTVSTKVGGFTLASTGVPAIWSRYTYNWEPTIVLDNISISGVVDHSAQTLASNATGELYIYTKDDAGEASGKFATVRRLSVDGLTILKSAAASPRPVVVIARDPASPISLRNVYAPGLVLSLIASTTVPTVLEGCTFSQLSTFTPGTGSLVNVGRGCTIGSVAGTPLGWSQRADTSGATLATLESEVNALKAVMRNAGLIRP